MSISQKTQSHFHGINHREKLKGFLPDGYRGVLSEKFDLAPSTIDNIVGGLRKDKKGVIAEVYRMALDESRKKQQAIEEIESLEFLFNKYKSV